MCLADPEKRSNKSQNQNQSLSSPPTNHGGTSKLVNMAESQHSNSQSQSQSLTSNPKRLSRRSHSFTEASTHFFTGTLLSVFFFVFAAYFPFVLAPDAATATYHIASFDYDKDLSFFDNTAWTWATDYGLAIAMFLIICSFPATTVQTQTSSNGTVQKNTRTIAHVMVRRSQCMLACYMISVTAGGLAHQFYTTLETRGTWSFRLLWTICVGTVTAAPAFMGSIATELNHIDWETESSSSVHSTRPIVPPSIPAWVWAAYATCSTAIVAWGGMSYQRPACDIFVAGVTQTPSTFYVMIVLGYGLLRHPISTWTRAWGAVGFILNAPLLPMYPLLVQYTDWSLGAVNTLLHTWLLVAWSSQGLSLRQVAMALHKFDEKAQKTS